MFEALRRAHANLATKEDIAAFARALQESDSEPATLLPRSFAERELQAEY